MQEYSTPQAVELPENAALTDSIRERAASSPDAVVFTRKVDDGWSTVPRRETAGGHNSR